MKKYISLLLLLLVATPMMAADFDLGQGLNDFINEMGFVTFFVQEEGWKNAVMILIGCFLLWLAIKKEYEPLLLLPIAFGMILSNLPGAGLFDSDMWNNEFLNPNSPYYHSYGHIMREGGLLDILYIGVKAGWIGPTQIHSLNAISNSGAKAAGGIAEAAKVKIGL